MARFEPKRKHWGCQKMLLFVYSNISTHKIQQRWGIKMAADWKGLPLEGINKRCGNIVKKLAGSEKRWFVCFITYSYILNVVAVSQVKMAHKIAAVVLWITMRQNNTHRTNLEGAREQKSECFECMEPQSQTLYDIWAFYFETCLRR